MGIEHASNPSSLGEYMSSAHHVVNGEITTGMTISKSATVINIFATNLGDEFRITQNNPHNTSQYPIWQIQQLNTGEAAFRILHSDDTGSKNWLFGELGRKSDGTIHRDYYHWVDGTKVSWQSYYATNSWAGRFRIGTTFWDLTAPSARLEVKGSVDEIQTVIQGNTSQTEDYLRIQQANAVVLANIDSYGRFCVREISGQDDYSSLYINGATNTGTLALPVIIRTGDASATSTLINRLTISADTDNASASWVSCKQKFDANSLPSTDPAVAGVLYYNAATNVVMVSRG